MIITIYHNPNCGTSRNTLAMIRQSGEEPAVIEYLKNPPTRERLLELIAAMGIPPRALLREKGTPFAELTILPVITTPQRTNTAAKTGAVESHSQPLVAFFAPTARPNFFCPWGFGRSRKNVRPIRMS
jgi:arsenate reductase (glutaredoxin)